MLRPTDRQKFFYRGKKANFFLLINNSYMRATKHEFSAQSYGLAHIREIIIFSNI